MGSAGSGDPAGSGSGCIGAVRTPLGASAFQILLALQRRLDPVDLRLRSWDLAMARACQLVAAAEDRPAEGQAPRSEKRLMNEPGWTH